MKVPWPFGHFGLKTLSVGIAILLWLFVSGDETVERGLRVPLEFQQFPSGIEIMGEARHSSTFACVAARARSPARTRRHRRRARSQGCAPGRRLYQITPEQVRVPFGVKSSR